MDVYTAGDIEILKEWALEHLEPGETSEWFVSFEAENNFTPTMSANKWRSVTLTDETGQIAVLMEKSFDGWPTDEWVEVVGYLRRAAGRGTAHVVLESVEGL